MAADKVLFADKSQYVDRPEIPENQKATFDNINELKRVSNSHADEIDNINNSQYAGSERYDLVVDLPVTGVATTLYRVDKDTDSNNGYYAWNGASYDKTQPLLDSTDDVVEGSQKVLTSGGAWTEKQILVNGSDAYVIADRIAQKTGGETVDLIAYDEKLRAARKKHLVYALYPHAKADNTIASNINDDDFDMNWDRLSTATYVDRNNKLVTAAIGSPVIEYIYDENDVLVPVFREEPTRTNLVITSAEGVYGGSMPASETNTISPDGTSNAVIPVPSTEAGRYEVIVAGGRFATGTKLTYSWYRKRISTPTGLVTTGDLNIKTLVNLTELEVDNARQIESDINGYDRFEAVVEIIDGALSSTFRAYYGDVVQVGNSSVAYYGHQLEEGGYATSLINTTGSEVTRLNDKNIFNENLGDKINLKEGVFFLNIAALSDDLTNRWISLYSSDYYFDNQITFRYTTSTNFIQIVSNSNGSQDVVLQATLSNITDFNKIAFRWKKDDWALSVGGAIVDTEISSNDFDESSPIDSLALDRGNRTNICFSKIKAIEIYNKGLSNEQLNALTS